MRSFVCAWVTVAGKRWGSAHRIVISVFSLFTDGQRSLSDSMDKLSTVSRSTELSSLDSSSTTTATTTASALDAEGASTADATAQDDESPEQSLNRQDIAMGVTPIAARESVIKYQMSMKEEHFTHLESFTVFVGTWNVNGQGGNSVDILDFRRFFGPIFGAFFKAVWTFTQYVCPLRGPFLGDFL